jgi:hypothetical protein
MKSWIEDFQASKEPVKMKIIGRCHFCGQPAVIRTSKLAPPDGHVDINAVKLVCQECFPKTLPQLPEDRYTVELSLTEEERQLMANALMAQLRMFKTWELEDTLKYTEAVQRIINLANKVGCNVDWDTLDPNAI